MFTSLSIFSLLFRPRRLTLKGYKQYWCSFKDTSISYFKSQEESLGEPIQQLNIKGIYRYCILIYAKYVILMLNCLSLKRMYSKHPTAI